ncbi:hypothetical protein CLAFUW4_09839 [Fulvia fulva]|uniref:SnoaL-like domain-containing protein n=1 Tax=Passalora fulva TaxID=5499 RepID=A0A9Q8PI81_PASFU|nr:uncharacterized protein CLAFUR5_12400 [Fulvia fulva]KAK4616921.1 hypothetical protein CLAFUR0_09838 [Fulvia fulva]UJO22950.1 hypothetical protein CLAFUR5_12400 [Fulvia fulva]WPV18795.1 hypothetical protein CLAFUW4_09839 [Fulvia fulva]
MFNMDQTTTTTTTMNEPDAKRVRLDPSIDLLFSQASSSRSNSSGTPETEPDPLHLSRRFATGLNERCWDDPCNAHFHPTYRALHDNVKTEITHEQEHMMHRALCAQFPDFHMEILSESIDMNEMAGTAIVWLFIRVTGTLPGVQRDAIGVFRWKKERGKWWCVYHAGLREPMAVY